MVRVGVIDAFGSVNGGAGRTAWCIPITLVVEIVGQLMILVRSVALQTRERVPWIFSCDRLCRRCSRIFFWRMRMQRQESLCLYRGTWTCLFWDEDDDDDDDEIPKEWERDG